MERILLLGANGQVGFELRRALPPLGETRLATRTGHTPSGHCLRADLSDADGLRQALDEADASVIVNAAAYTAVDRAEDEPALAQRVNGDALAVIGRWAADHDAAVVHYSTDYVFDGQGEVPWREDDPVSPLGVYGRSKLAGERALAESGCRHLILRTAWVYAARGHNFLLSMLRLARERDALRVVDDQQGSPTPAALIAAATAAILARWRVLPEAQQRARSGVYHLASSGHCSWHAFASAIIERAHAAGLLPRRVPVQAIPSSAFPTRAERPAWSALDGSRLAQTFDIALPDWQQGLELVLADLEAAGHGKTE